MPVKNNLLVIREAVAGLTQRSSNWRGEGPGQKHAGCKTRSCGRGGSSRQRPPGCRNRKRLAERCGKRKSHVQNGHMGRPDRIHLSCNRSSPEPLLPPPVLACSRLVTEIPAAESLVLRGGALRHQYSQFLRSLLPGRP